MVRLSNLAIIDIPQWYNNDSKTADAKPESSCWPARKVVPTRTDGRRAARSACTIRSHTVPETSTDADDRGIESSPSHPRLGTTVLFVWIIHRWKRLIDNIWQNWSETDLTDTFMHYWWNRPAVHNGNTLRNQFNIFLCVVCVSKRSVVSNCIN